MCVYLLQTAVRSYGGVAGRYSHAPISWSAVTTKFGVRYFTLYRYVKTCRNFIIISGSKIRAEKETRRSHLARSRMKSYFTGSLDDLQRIFLKKTLSMTL